MKFKIGDKVSFTLPRIDVLPATRYIGFVLKDHKQNRLIIRGTTPGNFQVYLSDMDRIYRVEKCP